MKRTCSQIDLDERRKIERWHHAGVSVDTIAEKLGRHRSGQKAARALGMRPNQFRKQFGKAKRHVWSNVSAASPFS